MNYINYWKEFAEKFNQVIGNNYELSECFAPIGDKKKNNNNYQYLYIKLKKDIGPISFCFSVGDNLPKLDINFYDKKVLYNQKDSRNVFLKEYNKKYPGDGLEKGKDGSNDSNPNCRCRFIRESKISDDKTSRSEGIKWQINKLIDVYKKVLDVNGELIMNKKYFITPEKLLKDYEEYLNRPDSTVKGGSIKTYIDCIKNNGKVCSEYIGKNDITELNKNDCDIIIKDLKMIFPNKGDGTIKKTGSYFTMFGNFLDDIRQNINAKREDAMKQTNDIKDKLKNNKQVILTGAPGTGKTYTVKEFVNKNTGEEKRGNRWEFVQFHPSYDYSDFVEGLRPVPNTAGNMFVRLDGCFKEFCRKIVMIEVDKLAGISKQEEDIDANKEKLNNAFEKYKENHKKQDEKDNKETNEEKTPKNIDQYYFIIDEINRADLSKVFGEIMYCLDEDYRGPDNAIPTQYSALKTYHKDSTGKFVPYGFDCFESGFFIPYNLHIIGTMNDIDRSVESFDFALRRRFIWVEVDANGSLDELKGMAPIKSSEVGINDLIKRAKDTNELLDSEKYKKLGLNKQFYLGKAYYNKFDGSQSSINRIYCNKIEPIIKEYTRGRDSQLVNGLLDEIKNTLKVGGIEEIAVPSAAENTEVEVEESSGIDE